MDIHLLSEESLRKQRDISRTGIPFLSKIPVLGYLFGSTTDRMSRTELILMVTPHVVGSQEEADALTEEYTNKVKGLKEKIEESRKKTDRGEVDQADIHIHKTPEETNPEETNIVEKQKQEEEKKMIINNLIIK